MSPTGVCMILVIWSVQEWVAVVVLVAVLLVGVIILYVNGE